MDEFGTERFRAVGHDYFPLNRYLVPLIEKGDPLELVAEPSNKYDRYAVRLLWRGSPIGYLPNRGLSCTMCFKRLRSGMTRCSGCGSFDLIRKGLAFRVTQAQLLERGMAVCIVDENHEGSKFPISATIYTTTGQTEEFYENYESEH